MDGYIMFSETTYGDLPFTLAVKRGESYYQLELTREQVDSLLGEIQQATGRRSMRADDLGIPEPPEPDDDILF